MQKTEAGKGADFKRLNILTYNFLIRPPPINYNGDDYKDERIERFAKDFMGDYDIIAFQEVFGLLSKRRERIIQLGAMKGLGYSHMSPAPPLMSFPAIVDGGLLILSRFPIVEADSFSYSRGIDADQLSCKGALYAKVQLKPKVFVHIFTTHLQADYEKNLHSRHSGNTPNQLMRLEQLKMLMRFVRSKTLSDTHPIIVLGDFNINSRTGPTDGHDSPEYLRALDVMRMDGLYAVHDLLKEVSPDGTHPVTICDSVENPDGSLTPTEPQLTPRNEYHWRRSIDYIFQLERTDAFFTPPQTTVGLLSAYTPAAAAAAAAASSSSSGEGGGGFGAMLCGCSPDIIPGQVRRTLFGKGAGFCGMGDDPTFYPPSATIMSATPRSIDDPYSNASRKVVRPHTVPDSQHTVVEKFQVETPDPYNQLSDHYGVRSYWRF